VPLANGVTSSSTSGGAAIRIGETTHCVLRGEDAAGGLTPIPTNSTAVEFGFREHLVNSSDASRMGNAITSLGDVNGDNVNDVLIGGSGRAYLYFGSGGGFPGSPDAPDVTFIGAPTVPGLDFGSRIAALGDINGDGRNDFAIANPYLGDSQEGAVYVFYGRQSGDTWPSTVSLNTMDLSMCGADVCFYGEAEFENLGTAVSPAGDYNNDGRNDLAIGASSRPTDHFYGGRLYVLLGRELGTGSRAGSFWSIPVLLPGDNPPGFYIDGPGDTGDVETSAAQLGIAIAAVGDVDGAPGADLLVSGVGDPFDPVIDSKLFFLSGRAHTAGLVELEMTDLELKASGEAGIFAAWLAPLRNWYDDDETGIPDVAVFQSAQNSFFVYLGDENGSGDRFASDTRILIAGTTVVGLGDSGLAFGRGYNPNVGGMSRSDLNGDGLDDMCVAATNDGPIYVYYGDVLADRVDPGGSTSTEYAAQFTPSARAGTTLRRVQPVGDLNGDGAIDIVVGEINEGTGAGGLTILY
jgi:hypothetical protein